MRTACRKPVVPVSLLTVKKSGSRIFHVVLMGTNTSKSEPQFLQIVSTMGATQSTSHAHPPSRALHILRVTPSSPASRTNIEPFFDFVVGFEGDTLSSGVDVSELEKIVEDHEEQVLNLLVWSSKHQSTRGETVVSNFDNDRD